MGVAMHVPLVSVVVFVPSGLCGIELHLRGNHISFNMSINHAFLCLVAPIPRLIIN